MAKILVVDDEPDVAHLVRQFFRREIRSGKLDFSFAHDGVEALEKLREEPETELVLTDINMPRMDGLTLLERMGEISPTAKAVVVTAYGDMKNIRVAMNRGAFDFLTKPIDFDDLDATIEKTLDHLRMLRDALKSQEQLVTLRKELDVAYRLQQSILPKHFPKTDAYEIYASMTPAKEVGGDFYDYFEVEPGKIGFAVADVSGKGMGAALFMAISRTLLHANAMAGLSPGACLSRVNKLLCVENESTMFVTLFYGILDTATGEVVYANGGHNAPYRVDDAEGEGEAKPVDRTGGLALGIDESAHYAEATVRLDPGDSLFLYTDGITEAFDREGRQFGEGRLAELLTESRALDPRAMLESVTQAIRDFAGEAEQTDDITCLVLKVTAHQASEAALQPVAEAEAPTLANAETHAQADGGFSITLKNDHSEVRRLAALIEDFGASAGLSSKLVHDLNLALDELLTNTIGYGYDDEEEHQITVRVSLGKDAVTAEIEDDAAPFDPFSVPPPDLESTLAERPVGGLGIHIVKSLMDRMDYQRKDDRNHVIIEKALSE